MQSLTHGEVSKTRRVAHVYESSIIVGSRDVARCVHLLEMAHDLEGKGRTRLLCGRRPPLHTHELPPPLRSLAGTSAEVHADAVDTVNVHDNKVAWSEAEARTRRASGMAGIHTKAHVV
jgi:hypothetical protein